MPYRWKGLKYKGQHCLEGNHGNQASTKWNTCHNPYLSIRGWVRVEGGGEGGGGGWEKKLADITGREFAMIRKDQQIKVRQC